MREKLGRHIRMVVAGEGDPARSPARLMMVLLCCLAVSLLALQAPDPARIAGVLALLAVSAAAVSRRGPGPTVGTAAFALGVSVLVVSGFGLPDTVDPRTTTLLVSLLAYPLLGIAFFEHLARHRRVRESDLIVEAGLLGTASALVIQAIVEWRVPVIDHAWSPAAVSLAAVVAGLDVSLAVIAGRALPMKSSRNSAIVPLLCGAILLAAMHLGSTLAMALGRPVGELQGFAVLPMVAFAAAASMDVVVPAPKHVAFDVHRFSPTHALVVGLSVLAAPAVLSLQVVSGVSVSATVAVGAAASAIVLAWHVVRLLRDRAVSEHRATHDDLTDLPNRVLFLDRLGRAITHASRHQAPVGVLYLDLDGFKDVNDTLGHEAGDQLLQITARRLQGCGRDEDTVARLAGDEFAILLPYITSADDVLVVAERVLAALDEPAVVGGQRVRNTGSVGVAVFPQDGATPLELMTAADSAMYRAKDHGGASVGVYSSELYRHAASRLEIENALVEGLDRAELVLHYQPIVHAADGRIAGAEALVRWQHPTRGLLSPADFIPVAEQSDLISAIGRHVLRDACGELARWAVAGFGDRFISVNVSGRQFQGDIVSDVTSALRETGVEARRLLLELTESTAVDDLDCVAQRLHELRDLGVYAAIDDFGTGYCGLQYLGDLPVSTLKLDRSFVQSMTPSSAAIVAATIAMAHSLGLSLVAEGVETSEQQRFLERSGCDRLQGYHIGRPMPGDQLLALLRAEASRETPVENGRSTVGPAIAQPDRRTVVPATDR
ncbi:putative bifunctional diguanylate cyclase/phosphodiesterase [Actinospongicola halichondriae]|uniref:putative bifunctional diguanylate cyclase/phosphodiesterase n=1 Tax=Actinospongicola halichondriae TaxID=3236844 RepID=UPI003D50ED77